jgi:hypothetical protein
MQRKNGKSEYTGKSRGKSNALLPSVYSSSSPVYLSPTLSWPCFLAATAGREAPPFARSSSGGRRRRAPTRYALPSPSFPSSLCETEHPEPYCKLVVLGSPLHAFPSLPLTRSLGLPFLAATTPWPALRRALRRRRASDRYARPFPSLPAAQNRTPKA